MTKPLEIGVIGAGIVGLAHAWSAAERGCRVTLFERSERACGASIRNFGMVWPIGQPAGELHELALLSRGRWLQLAKSADSWLNPCGSIHLAHRDDEAAVLREFAQQAASLGFECEWLSADEVLNRTPAANAEGLLGGLFSPTEMCVNPRIVIARMPHWLAENFGVRCEFSTVVTSIDERGVRASDGRRWEFDRVLICCGADLETLFPEILRESGLRRCKLQMLKTRSQANRWRIGPHLASGLTLRHYRNFEVCPSLPALKQRIAEETPELDRFGIHVMASQNEAGEVILGDSHEYDVRIEPFDKAEIDDLMLRELRQVLQLPDWTITEHWNGVYTKHPSKAWFEAEPLPNVHVCTGLGSAGMTMAFGVAEEWSRRNPR